MPDERISLRRIAETEAGQMAELARKRNVFARHSWENSFYLSRIATLSGKTVIEVFAEGELDEMMPDAAILAERFEQVTLVSSIFGLQRKRTQALLAISPHKRYGFDLGISDGFRFLRSSSRREPQPRGIVIDATFVRRFFRLGFPILFRVCVQNHVLASRLGQALAWLAESRQEPALSSAAVKTAIALESLLVADERESLRGPLAERSAFLLSDQPETRKLIAGAVKRFYDIRSSVVHGGRKKVISVPAAVLEGADRLTTLVALCLAANASSFATFDAVVRWVDARKWGDNPFRVTRPFPQSHLTRAIGLLTRESVS